MSFLRYLRYNGDNCSHPLVTTNELSEYRNRVTFMRDDFAHLLRMPHAKFWCQVCYTGPGYNITYTPTLPIVLSLSYFHCVFYVKVTNSKYIYDLIYISIYLYILGCFLQYIYFYKYIIYLLVILSMFISYMLFLHIYLGYL